MKHFFYTAIFILTGFTQANSQATSVIKEEASTPRFTASISGGASYLLRKIPDALPAWYVSYLKKLQSGYHFSADLSFYTYKSSGFGIKYSVMKTSNQTGNVSFYYGTTFLGTGLLRDDITVEFIGPTIFGIAKFGKRESFLFSTKAAIGYVTFTNKTTLLNRFGITSNTWGASSDLSVEYFITKHFSVGINSSAVISRVRKLTINNATITIDKSYIFDYRFNLSRIDAGLEVRIYL